MLAGTTEVEKKIAEGREAQKNPIGVINGRDVYTVDQFYKIGTAEHLNKSTLPRNMKEKMTPQLKYNPDGSYAGTRVDKPLVCAIDMQLDNRFKKVSKAGVGGGKEYWVVIDTQACSQQAVGNIYTTQIDAYVIKQNKDTKEIYVDRIERVSDTEFISEFRNRFDTMEMFNIGNVINKYGNIKSTGDKLEF